MEEELLEGIIASVFLIIVTLIGAYLPYLAAEFFNSHNPYLVLETAGFLTYATSEPGYMATLIPMSTAGAPGLEFRIIPPVKYSWIFPPYDNKDFAVAIGYCVKYNLVDQLFSDLFFAVFTAVSSYYSLGGFSESGITREAVSAFFKSLPKFTAETFAASEIQYGAINFYNNYNLYNGNILQDFETSFISSLSGAGLNTAVNVGETIANTLIYGFLATGPVGVAVAVGVDFAINAAITLAQYFSVQSNEYNNCYHYNPGTGNYYEFETLLYFPVYYNPEFDIYNWCTFPILCNYPNHNNPLAYDKNNENNDYIIKIEMGYYDQSSNTYYFPLYLSLVKSSSPGMNFGYINVSVIIEKYT